MIKKQVSFFACLSVFSCAAFAANVFYVSPKGVDEGATGAKDNPFGTLRAAYAAAKKSGTPAEIVLADGISHASAEEAAAGIDCRFKRTKSGCEYIITFPKRYIEPLKLRSGTACGFGLFLHDRDKNDKGEVVYGGVSNATEPGVHTDNSPQFWPLMIFR